MIRWNKVLVPIDFSENSRTALRYGVEIVRDRKARLLLLHVINQKIIDALQELSIKGYQKDFVPVMERMLQDREAELESFVPTDWCQNLALEFHLTQGKPSHQIIDFAKKNRIDLIVLGTRGRSPLVSALLGSAARDVVHHAPCPVLVVRPTEHDVIE